MYIKKSSQEDLALKSKLRPGGPICEHHFTHWTHPDISLPFWAGGRRLKNFRFSRICMSPWWKSSSACCGLNFDATDLPNSSFEPLYPKLFRGNPEVDLVSTVWPPDLPNVRRCWFFYKEMPLFSCFFGLNKLSRSNDRLSPLWPLWTLEVLGLELALLAETLS